jgi:hypothetical protein
VLKAPATALMLGLLACAVPARGQMQSKATAVTLVASVQESFALVAMSAPAEADNRSSVPSEMQVGLSWRLRPKVLSQGTFVPSDVQDQLPIFSFLPAASEGIKPVFSIGNRETEHSGVAAVLLAVPKTEATSAPVLRLRAIIL